jgi:hypothetical protein
MIRLIWSMFLLLVIALGGVAACMAFAIWAGYYDPVRDDQMAPADLPGLYRRLTFLVALLPISLAAFAWSQYTRA